MDKEKSMLVESNTAQKMKFSIKDFLNKCDQICSFLRIWSHLLKKSLMENLISCAAQSNQNIPTKNQMPILKPRWIMEYLNHIDQSLPVFNLTIIIGKIIYINMNR